MNGLCGVMETRIILIRCRYGFLGCLGAAVDIDCEAYICNSVRIIAERGLRRPFSRTTGKRGNGPQDNQETDNSTGQPGKSQQDNRETDNGTTGKRTTGQQRNRQ